MHVKDAFGTEENIVIGKLSLQAKTL